MGVEMTVECFVVVVIGGLGSLGGAILGGLIIGQVISFVSLLASDWSNVAIFITMLLILLVRTRGLVRGSRKTIRMKCLKCTKMPRMRKIWAKRILIS